LPAGIDFWIALVAQNERPARAALSALAIHRHDDRIKQRIAVALAGTNDLSLQQWFARKFP
jgi:hypothetical protein